MKSKDVITMRNELLDRMVEEFHDTFIPAVRNETEDPEAPGIVRAILDQIGGDEGDAEGVMGEFFFSPMSSEDDEVHVFNAMMTISDQVPEDNLPAFFEAMSYINFHIPLGCFAYDKDHSYFCFRLSVSIPMNFDKEAIYGLMSAAAANAAHVTDDYMQVLLDVAENKFSVDEVMDILGGRREK